MGDGDRGEGPVAKAVKHHPVSAAILDGNGHGVDPVCLLCDETRG